MTRSEFERIAPQLRAQMLQTALDLFGRQDDAEDVAQDAMLQLLRYCEQIDGCRNVTGLAVREKSRGQVLDKEILYLSLRCFQNKKLSALLIAAPGSKKAKKAQKLVQDLMEKYMKEATKVMDSDVADTSRK